MIFGALNSSLWNFPKLWVATGVSHCPSRWRNRAGWSVSTRTGPRSGNRATRPPGYSAALRNGAGAAGWSEPRRTGWRIGCGASTAYSDLETRAARLTRRSTGCETGLASRGHPAAGTVCQPAVGCHPSHRSTGCGSVTSTPFCTGHRAGPVRPTSGMNWRSQWRTHEVSWALATPGLRTTGPVVWPVCMKMALSLFSLLLVFVSRVILFFVIIFYL